jgi:hypothetical protein
LITSSDGFFENPSLKMIKKFKKRSRDFKVTERRPCSLAAIAGYKPKRDWPLTAARKIEGQTVGTPESLPLKNSHSKDSPPAHRSTPSRTALFEP